MKNIAFTVFLICVGSLPLMTRADDNQKTADSVKNGEQVDSDESSELAKDASERGTPPWTNDSANINLQQPRTSLDTVEKQQYTPEDFTVKPEWEKIFADDDHFSTTTGKELYETMCQACHMEDGQGAQGAGHYPSFVGNERLRSPDYPIDVIINGLRGMPPFGDKLSNQQISDVVNYLRTSFGNQLDDGTTSNDVARVRH